ncbi:conserved protein of unknown function [Methylorubrum extorquens DM4]|jgi:hypothetical protein|uniref:Uncharacterized protein n=1 Tax=Methylorubrum extorquens (strain DSM 6343 / CIP 106787 / DM4) TaxID=661410 RepID=C7CEE9_METED|nr:hypothetical protein [Methylorubrum extorquens]CAX24285.1 conserved protein of unknown function [Methylorubrum extorquens DM4]
MQGAYDRLRVHVFASWRDVVRAANTRIASKHRRDPAMREARKRFYRDMLGCHQRHQDLVLTFRL